MPMGQPQQLLSVDSVADLLGVPKATLYRWRSHGEGPPGLRIGRHLRYRAEDVARWIDDRVEMQHSPKARHGFARGQQGGRITSPRESV